VSASILAIEDNLDNMELFGWMLEDEGYAFEGAASAEEGLACLKRRSFDLVLMDIALPGIDGTEATRRIRADTRFTRIPVIAVTAYGGNAAIEEILASGVNAVVHKPISHSRLINAIGTSLLEGPSP